MQETTTTVTTALTGAFDTIATQVIDALIAILPIALPVLGAMLTVAVGIKLFRRLTNKG